LYLAALERVLRLYALAYDPKRPVVCFDERPCFLIGDVVEPLVLASGRVRKEHHAYEKKGSCALLAAIEPLTGRRIAQVHQRRTKKEFTLICQAIAEAYPEAETICLVLDNLNTHKKSSFYDHLPADDAEALANRFEFYHTPKSGSWLNMIEIEFSALARLCLNRRIPTMAQLEAEVVAFFQERSRLEIKIHWQFSVDDCRRKLNSQYLQVHPDNQRFMEV
jgi:hypothetical protein